MRHGGWDLRTAVAFGLVVLAWGGNYLFVRVGEAYVAPLWLATLRAGVGALGLGVYLLARHPSVAFERRDVRDALLLGIPNTAVFLGLWFTAAPSIAPGQTAVLIYTFPLWVALVSPTILGGRLGRSQWIALGVGFAGVFLVSQPWVGAEHGGLPYAPTAELLAAAVAWAVATVAFQRRFRPEQLSLANGYQLVGGALALLVTSLLVGAGSVPTAPTLWLAVLWLGLFGTAFAYGIWFHLLRSVHASTLSAYAFLVPIAALALSATFTGERLDVAQGVGVVAVVTGIFLVSRRPLTPVVRSPVGSR